MLTNSNKKLNLSETVGDFFIRLRDLDMPSDRCVLVDESVCWISLGSDSCFSCFEFRYRTWRQAQLLAKTGRYKDVLAGNRDAINFDSLDLSKFFELVKKNTKNYSGDVLFGFAFSTGDLIERALVLPEDSCSYCYKKWDILDDELPTTIDQVETFLTQWFGLVATINVFDQLSGIESDCSFIALVLSIMRRFGEYAPILCAGQADTKEQARLKAVMEYIERYAQTNSSKEILIDYQVNDYQKKTKEEICSDQSWQELWDEDVAKKLSMLPNVYYRGENIISGSPALVPAYLVDRKVKEYSFFEASLAPFAPTTSGFAAHVDVLQAREHGMLELIERDACMRWWCAPEVAIRVQPSTMQQKQITFLKMQLEQSAKTAINIVLLSLDACCLVPTALVIATSQDENHGPALLVGSASSFKWDCAVDKALSELRMGLYNYQMYVQKPLEQLPKDFSSFSWVRTPSDHAEVYYAGQLRSQLSFLSVLQEYKPVAFFSESSPQDYHDLLKLLSEQNIPAYALSRTPRFCQKSTIEVSRVVMPSLYPLQFGFSPTMKASLCSSLSQARQLPHCFF